ncbi:MAG: dephospho-CoA kinase [Solobacterium sp.]|nr:dephospho-CoA kinase [Solobacterium sp.]
MKKIGITGTIASGKTTVSILLRRRGMPVFNSDQYAKMCLHKGNARFDEIVKTFGEGILDETGDINNKKLAAIVFSNEEERQKLNAIVHPFVFEGMHKFFAQKEDLPFAFAEVPLLFECHLENEFDEIIVVTCQKETAIQRMMEDRNYTREEAEARYLSQIDPEKQIAAASIVIYNDESIQDLDRKVNQMIGKLRGRNGKKA